MIDSVQIVLFVVIVVLAILLVILGIQVFFILQELRKTFMKTNKLLDNAETISENIAAPFSSISGLASGFKSGSILGVARFVKKLFDDESDNKHDTKK